MRRLIVLTFATERGAQDLFAEVVRLQGASRVVLEAGAVLVRLSDGTTRVTPATGRPAGPPWSAILGPLRVIHWLGGALRPAPGAHSGTGSSVGPDDPFLAEVSQAVRPGQSALVLLVRSPR